MKTPAHGTCAPDACGIVELRQYTLHPGRRDALIDLFDREFIETQEAVGMAVMGQFRDLGDAERFVWLRGFHDMPARAAGLAAFYGGPVWQAHRDAANATMAAFDDVLLLRPAWPGSGIAMRGRERAVPGSAAAPAGQLDARVLHLRRPADEVLLALCRDHLSPLFERAGARVLGWYATEASTNNFTPLPVREGEPVLAVFVMFGDAAPADAFTQGGLWEYEAQPLLAPWLARPTQHLRLAPTARSALHA